MKLRYLIAAGIVALLIGGAVWLYDNADEQMATGAGGLPLIKASTDPIKLPPDDPGGEVMPHAESTVFSAISGAVDEDPSMTGVEAPAAVEEAPAPDVSSAGFAGLRTGFAVPATPETKTESLFGDAPAAEPASTGSKYVSGIAPEAIGGEPAVEPVAEPVQAPVAEPEPVVEAPKEELKPEPKAAPVEEPVVVAEPETPVEEPAVITEQPDQSAQALEAQEKAMIRPMSKPTPPVSAPKEEVMAEAAPEPKAEPKTEPKPEAKVETKPTPLREVEVAPIQPRSVGMSPVVEQGAAPSSTSSAPSAAPAPASSSGYVIQLSSTTNQADAERSWLHMQSLYPDQLRDLKPSYKTAEVPGKGTMIRLRAGVISREEANARCDAIRATDPRGGGCLVLRN